jgi:hypothetical protein
MESRSGCYIDIEIYVMHSVKPPEKSVTVKKDMLSIYGKVKYYNSQYTCNSFRHRHDVEHPPISFLTDESNSHGSSRKNQADKEAVESGHSEIVKPADTLGFLQGPTRSEQLPYGHEDKNAKEESKAYKGFIINDEHVHFWYRRLF